MEKKQNKNRQERIKENDSKRDQGNNKEEKNNKMKLREET
jgi:hypothetical protein